MVYRDDQKAMRERLAALEREVERTEQLEARVRELEEENARLRAAVERGPSVAPSTKSVHDVSSQEIYVEVTKEIYVDVKVREYAHALVAATGAPTERVLSGALPEDAERLLEAAKKRAVAAERAYVMPADVRAVMPEALSGRVILERQALDEGLTVEAFLARVAEQVEVP